MAGPTAIAGPAAKAGTHVHQFVHQVAYVSNLNANSSMQHVGHRHLHHSALTTGPKNTGPGA
jgi:hypothetical protein